MQSIIPVNMLRIIICSLLLSLNIESVSSKTIIRPPTDYVCPEVKCSEDCPRGYTHDIHGCNTCDCKHTPFQTEVGKCPKSSKSNIECPAKLSHSCDTDYDCSGGKKCCTFGCNRKCIYPKHGPLIYPPACGPGVCFISCPYGNIVDSRGCETCRCKPKPRPIPYPCPRIMCLTRHCYHGGGPLKDRHGCPTCGCRTRRCDGALKCDGHAEVRWSTPKYDGPRRSTMVLSLKCDGFEYDV